MAIGVTSAAVFGTIVANNQTYKSYQVQPSSPGAQVLNNYHLTQNAVRTAQSRRDLWTQQQRDLRVPKQHGFSG